jgi:hypothetical protein
MLTKNTAMLFYKNLLCAGIVLCFSGSAFAQAAPNPAWQNVSTYTFKKNIFFINAATSRMQETLPEGTMMVLYTYGIDLNMPMVSYERLWTSKINTRIAFAAWTPFSMVPFNGLIEYWQTGKQDPYSDFVIQDTKSRSHYYYLDLTGGYALLQKKHHRIDANAGPSYTWGENNEVNMSYLGITANISYTYSFWQDRLRAGVFLAGRYYPGLNHNRQEDLGIKAGFAF